MTEPVVRLLPDGQRLHLQHGPIDLVVGADGSHDAREAAFVAASGRFQTVLMELVAELPALRRSAGESGPVSGAIAARMVEAVLPFARDRFVTPMAAVAGAVAETILDAMCLAAPLARCYVNNGGDIALHLSDGEVFEIAIAGPEGQWLGHVVIAAADRVRGVATSGQRGRSFSFGIADSVTVLGPTAAGADVAATLIANEVDLPDHPAIFRVPACDIQPDTDLGARAVTRGVGQLTAPEVRLALDRGTAAARAFLAEGRIEAAALYLRGQCRIVGDERLCQWKNIGELNHA